MNLGKDKHQSHEDAQKSRHREEPATAGAARPESLPATGAGAAAAVRAAAPPAEPPAETIAALQDRLLRLSADYDNFRKRALREKNEIHEIAASDLMLDILPVLDHIQMGIQAAADHKAIQDGLRLISDQLMGVLSKFGLIPFDVAKQPFDPARCEAISCVASDQVPEGVVLAQARRGYMLRSKLLRPAQVVVSSGPVGRQAEYDKKHAPVSRDTPAAAED